jgi:hypothetical protein
MPTVPRPSSGSGPLGSVGVAASKPVFQNFQVPSFKTADTKLLGQAGPGVTKVGEAGATIAADINKRRLNQLDASASELERKLLDSEIGLNNFTGNEALAHIAGTKLPAGMQPGPSGETLQKRYERKLKEFAAAAGVNEFGGKETADIWIRNKVTAFGSSVDKYAIVQQKAADAEAMGVKIADAIETVRANPNNKLIRDAAVETVESAVKDPNFGLAKLAGLNPTSTDPKVQKSVDELLQKNLAALDVAQIQKLISLGNITGAVKILDQQTKPGGSLHGRPEAIALNSAVLTTRQSVKGKTLFRNVSTLYPGNATKQLGAILQIKKAEDQALALSEWKVNNALVNTVKRDQISKETLALVKFMRDNPGVPIDETKYQALAQFNPRVVYEAGARARGVATGVRMDEATAAHVAAGGSAVGSDIAMSTLSDMAKEKPADFIKLMANPKNIKSFTNASQWVQLRSKEITAKHAEMDAVTKPMKYDSVLTDLGFKDSSSKYKNLIQNPDLHKALTEARRRIFEQTGKGATIEDLTPIIAKFALPVDASMTTNPTLYHLSEYAKEGTVDSKTMLDTPLDLDQDRDLVPLHYALDRKATAKEIRGIVDGIDGPVTLRMIAEKVKGGVEVLKLGQWEQDRVDFHNAVLEMGFPPQFIAEMLDIMGEKRSGWPHTEANAKIIADQFLRQPEAYKERFHTWASGGDL